jgi:hypothetical protein
VVAESLEADVVAAQVGLQAGVLHRDEVGIAAGLVVVGVPLAGRGDEGAAGLPVNPRRVFDLAVLAVLVELVAEQRVAARLAVEETAKPRPPMT